MQLASAKMEISFCLNPCSLWKICIGNPPNPGPQKKDESWMKVDSNSTLKRIFPWLWESPPWRYPVCICLGGLAIRVQTLGQCHGQAFCFRKHAMTITWRAWNGGSEDSKPAKTIAVLCWTTTARSSDMRHPIVRDIFPKFLQERFPPWRNLYNKEYMEYFSIPAGPGFPESTVQSSATLPPHYSPHMSWWWQLWLRGRVVVLRFIFTYRI